MNKTIITAMVLLLFSVSLASAVNYTVNVSFYEDMGMVSPYLNEFMYVYAQHQVCQSYYLGGINCTYECRNGRYSSGVASISNIPEGKVWDFFILQPASFDNATACPRKVNPVIDYNFDQKLINENANYYYFLNETQLPTPTRTSFNFSTWLNIGYWVLVILAVVLSAYYTAGWIAPAIVFVIMVIIKLLLFA